MKAICIHHDPPLQVMPFGEAPGELPILNQTLAEYQRAVLQQFGVEIVEETSSDEAYIFFGEEVWFTETLMEELLRNVPESGNGRLRCADELWNEHNSSVLSTGDGIFRLGFCFGELPADLSELPTVEMDFQLRDGDPIDLHPKMVHALRPMRVGAMMAFELKHWCDVLRVNQFAILEKFERVKWQWSQSSFFAKCWTVIATIFKVHSINPQKVARRIGQKVKCKIHPTAVIEACEIGDNVEIGPYAVVGYDWRWCQD